VTQGARLGTVEIQRLLPHRFPMLMVDAVLELEPGRRCKATKNVTINEHFFQGHFPGEPIMPGVLIVECVAQTAGLVLGGEAPAAGAQAGDRRPPYLLAVDHFKFKRPVAPGDTLEVEVSVTRRLGSMAKVSGAVRVRDELVAAGELTVGGGT
jgi:3-hydroxyacyl-[acyl-carrier-protein] dehydratase